MLDMTLNVIVIDREESPVIPLMQMLAEDPSNHLRLEWAGDLATGVERISHGGIDVALLGLSLPDSVGPATFERAQVFASTIPFVVVAGPSEEAWAEKACRLGAVDWLPHGDMVAAVVPRTLRHAVERHRLLVALRQMAAMDEQTRLYTRRGLLELGTSHMKVARRMARPLLLIHADVEDLGGVNRALGEEAGDDLILAAAHVLRDVFRGSDLVARIGGDEFAVLAHDARESDAPGILQRIEDALRAVNGSGRLGARLSLTVAIAGMEGRAVDGMGDLLEEVESRPPRHRLTGVPSTVRET